MSLFFQSSILFIFPSVHTARYEDLCKMSPKLYTGQKKKHEKGHSHAHYLSLSRLRLSRIIVFVEVKIFSLFLHGNLTTGNKILWKRGEIAPQEQFLLFLQYFNISLRSLVIYSFVKCGCSIYYFLNSANLICRCTDISKYFRESLDFEIMSVDYVLRDLTLLLLTPNLKLNTLHVIQPYRYVVRGNVLSGVIFFLF